MLSHVDVAISNWVTATSYSEGLISIKSAILMNNNLILITKYYRKKEKYMRRRRLPFIFFPPPLWLPSSPSRHVQPKQQAQRQQKTELSREDHVNSKVGFLKFCYLLFLANNYETVI